jgi:quercetin dioxygenase-like cupin family protein
MSDSGVNQLPETIVRSTSLIIVAALLVGACSKSSSSNDAPSAPARQASHTAVPENSIQWGPAPAVFPPGAEMAVLQGDPSKSEPFTVRLRLPNGYKIPPHTHPTAENVTVLTGTFLAGSGTQFDESQLEEIGRDGFLSIPAEHAHYAMARGLTVVQVHAIGPFALTYVNAADNPVTRVARWSPDQQPIGAAHQFP